MKSDDVGDRLLQAMLENDSTIVMTVYILIGCATLALLYHVSAFIFCYAWHEGPTVLHSLLFGLTMRLLQWTLLFGIFFLILESINNLSNILYLVVTIGFIVGSAALLFYQVRRTRVFIVEGGRYIAPNKSTSSAAPMLSEWWQCSNNNSNSDNGTNGATGNDATGGSKMDETAQSLDFQSTAPQSPQPSLASLSSGRVIVITGANTGIGKETVHQLVQSFVTSASCASSPPHLPPPHIFLLCRSIAKGQAAVHDITARLQSSPNTSKPQPTSTCTVIPHLHVVECDLTSFASIRRAVSTIFATVNHVDVLINNAGVMLSTLSYTTKDDHESMLQANFLGPFLLTKLVLLQTLSNSHAPVVANNLDNGDEHGQNNNGHSDNGMSVETTTTTTACTQQQCRPLIVLNVTSSTYRMALSTFDAYHLDALQCRPPPTHAANATNTATTETAASKPANDDGPYRKFTLFGQYAATKWCNILHSVFLSDASFLISTDTAATTSGSNNGKASDGISNHDPLPVVSMAIHPGLVRTDVVRHMPWYLKWPNVAFASILQTLQKTPSQGAWCTLHVLERAIQGVAAAAAQQEGDGTASSLTPLSHDASYYWVNRQPQDLTMELPLVREQAQLLWDWAINQVGLTPDELQRLKAMTVPPPLLPRTLGATTAATIRTITSNKSATTASLAAVAASKKVI